MKTYSYAFTVYEYHSIDKEEFTIFGRTLEEVEKEIKETLKQNKSFRVVVFDKEVEV